MDKLFSDFMLLAGFSMIGGGVLRSARDILIVASLRRRQRSQRSHRGISDSWTKLDLPYS
jgi:hypothetical protein